MSEEQTEQSFDQPISPEVANAPALAPALALAPVLREVHRRTLRTRTCIEEEIDLAPRWSMCGASACFFFVVA